MVTEKCVISKTSCATRFVKSLFSLGVMALLFGQKAIIAKIITAVFFSQDYLRYLQMKCYGLIETNNENAAELN